jgi:hypothetical protein
MTRRETVEDRPAQVTWPEDSGRKVRRDCWLQKIRLALMSRPGPRALPSPGWMVTGDRWREHIGVCAEHRRAMAGGSR